MYDRDQYRHSFAILDFRSYSGNCSHFKIKFCGKFVHLHIFSLKYQNIILFKFHKQTVMSKIKDCKGMPALIMVIHISIFITFEAGEDYRFSSIIIIAL